MESFDLQSEIEKIMISHRFSDFLQNALTSGNCLTFPAFPGKFRDFLPKTVRFESIFSKREKERKRKY